MGPGAAQGVIHVRADAADETLPEPATKACAQVPPDRKPVRSPAVRRGSRRWGGARMRRPDVNQGVKRMLSKRTGPDPFCIFTAIRILKSEYVFPANWLANWLGITTARLFHWFNGSPVRETAPTY